MGMIAALTGILTCALAVLVYALVTGGVVVRTANISLAVVCAVVIALARSFPRTWRWGFEALDARAEREAPGDYGRL
jgi:hypothetical protein